jgi:hypothetical protein
MVEEATSAAESKGGEAGGAAGDQNDRWDELMAKLDAIAETLRKACESAPQEPAQADQASESAQTV